MNFGYYKKEGDKFLEIKQQSSQANKIIDNLNIVKVVLNAKTIFEVVVVFAILRWIKFMERIAPIIKAELVEMNQQLEVVRYASQNWRDLLHKTFYKTLKQGGCWSYKCFKLWVD